MKEGTEAGSEQMVREKWKKEGGARERKRKRDRDREGERERREREKREREREYRCRDHGAGNGAPGCEIDEAVADEVGHH